ncbi:MAG: TetR/AcrR family transcriptional regulator [Thermoanaerobaculia bacterium]
MEPPAIPLPPAPRLAPAAGDPDRSATRRRAMLDAARELFLERGFEGTSVVDVVRRSGGSLATLYHWFGSKEGLFEAIADEVGAEIVAPLDAPDFEDLPLEEALTQFGRSFLERVLCARSAAWHRMCVAEGMKFPELRAALLRSGPGRVRERLGAYLAAQAAAGRLRVEDPQAAALQFLAVLKSESQLALVCGEAIDVGPAEIARQVARGVDLFLYGCAKRRPSRSAR